MLDPESARTRSALRHRVATGPHLLNPLRVCHPPCLGMFKGMDDFMPTEGPADDAARDGVRVPFATRLDRSLIRDFKHACVRREVTMQVGVARAIRAWIEADETECGS